MVVINGIADLVEKLSLEPEAIIMLLNNRKQNLQVLCVDSLSKVGATYGGMTALAKENIEYLLFGGSLNKQLFIENLSLDQKNAPVSRNVLHSLKDDVLEAITIPTEVTKK